MEFFLNFLPGAGLVLGIMELAVYLGLHAYSRNVNVESSRRVYLYVSIAAFSVSLVLLVYLNSRQRLRPRLDRGSFTEISFGLTYRDSRRPVAAGDG